MTTILEGLLYTKHDEWVKVDGTIATIGITDYAQDALSDIVFIELPDTGEVFDAEDEFGTVESVKAVAELYMPVSGTITAANEDLADEPEVLNSNPYESWIVKVELSNPDELGSLMNPAAYKAYCDERS